MTTTTTPSAHQTDPVDPAETFDRVNAINLRGVWACMKHELAQMRTQGSGAIVNCSSLGGLVGLPGRAAYHASKHGVIGLTSSAALQYAPRGIRINAVSQSPTKTTAGGGIKGFDSLFDFAERIAPLGNADAASCADYVVSLFSDLTRMVTMQTLFHDGGFSTMGISDAVIEQLAAAAGEAG